MLHRLLGAHGDGGWTDELLRVWRVDGGCGGRADGAAFSLDRVVHSRRRTECHARMLCNRMLRNTSCKDT